MTNAPALIVHYRRFTLVIVLLLAIQLVVAGIGLSIELHKTQAGIALILSPQILVLFAAYLAKIACDRWATSAICLTVSAEGLMLPGLTDRPIPWTAVKNVRGVCCSPRPEHAAVPRHYVLFDVEAPEIFGAGPQGALQWLTTPVPDGAPRITLDLSELDTGKEAVLDAVRRFHPAAVAVAETDRPVDAPAAAAEATLRFPSLREIAVGAGQIRAGTAALVARRGEIRSAALAAWRRLLPRAKAQTLAVALALTAAAAALQRSMVARARREAQSLRDRSAANLARWLDSARGLALGIRHRFDRSF